MPPLRCLLTTSVLLKPSLVDACKLSGKGGSSVGVENTDGPAAEEGDGETEPGPAQPASTTDTFTPQPPSNSQGCCKLCEDDDTVSTADKAKLEQPTRPTSNVTKTISPTPPFVAHANACCAILRIWARTRSQAVLKVCP